MYIRDDEITKLMLASHARLSSMINQVVGGSKLINKKQEALFAEFTTKLLRHIQIEEESIFGLSEFKDARIIDTTHLLYQQHRDIKTMVKNISTAMEDNQEIDSAEFTQLIYEHTYLENTVFYPYLDKNLPVEQLKKILAEIKNDL